MRTVHWLFALSAALFIGGIGFIVAAGRMEKLTPAAAPAPAVAAKPVATVKQLMAAIVSPSSTAVFNAVSTTVSEKGVENVAPRNDEEWAVLGSHAAALAEVGNMMMADGRAIDRGDWIKMSRALIDAGQLTLKAVSAKNTEAVLAAGEQVNEACDGCHQRYMRQ
jgi:hypothetical protein